MSPQRRTKGDGGLFQRADGMWIGRVDIPSADGKRRRKQIASKDFATAAKKLRALRQEIDAGRLPATATTTVAKWLEHWLETIRGPHVGPEMFRYYEHTIRLYINPRIGSKRLDRLTAEDIRAMERDLQESSTRNAQKAHQTLQTALKDAVVEGVVGRNVVDAVRAPKHAKVEREPLAFPVAKHVIHTALASSDETWASRWVAAFLTGARPAELRGLRWSYIDLDNGLADLAWQLRRVPRKHGCGDTCGKTRPGFCPEVQWKIPPGFELQPCHRSLAWTRPKTAAGTRIVPLIPPVVAMLRELAAIDTNNPHGLVWHHHDGRPISQENEDDAWAALMAEAELVGVSQYQARHTTATLLLEAGVDEQTRMKIIGHSSVAAQRMYAHVDHTQTRAAMTHLNELL